MTLANMKYLTTLCTFLCLLSISGCRSEKGDSRLDGTWRSNKDETVAAWRRDGVIPEEVIGRFEEEVLGKTTVTYSGRHAVIKSGEDWTEESEYDIIDSGDDFVVIEGFSKVWQRKLQHRIEFVENGYWISNDEILKGFTEKFDRMIE